MDIAGKVVVVTGGGNGIGQQVVLELLRRGARVAAVDIREESLNETVEMAAPVIGWPHSWSTSPIGPPPKRSPGR